MTITLEEFNKLKDTPILDLTQEDFQSFFDYIKANTTEITKPEAKK